MGKGGRGGKIRGPPRPETFLDEDTLLNQAIAENKALAAKQAAAYIQQIADADGPEGKLLTMPEALEKLDRVRVFSLVVVYADGMKDSFAVDGKLHFFVSQEDAQAAMNGALRVTPDAKLRLELVSLGRAFALTQGLMGLDSPVPCRLHFPRAVVKAEGERGVPEDLREQMRAAGPFPLFMTERLSTSALTPVFLTRDDLVDCWMKRGFQIEDLPEPTISDLRILVARMMVRTTTHAHARVCHLPLPRGSVTLTHSPSRVPLSCHSQQEKCDWQSMVMIQPAEGAEAVKKLQERERREAETTLGFKQGLGRLKQVAQKVAVEDGDAPPPLQAHEARQ